MGRAENLDDHSKIARDAEVRDLGTSRPDASREGRQSSGKTIFSDGIRRRPPHDTGLCGTSGILRQRNRLSIMAINKPPHRLGIDGGGDRVHAPIGEDCVKRAGSSSQTFKWLLRVELNVLRFRPYDRTFWISIDEQNRPGCTVGDVGKTDPPFFAGNCTIFRHQGKVGRFAGFDGAVRSVDRRHLRDELAVVRAVPRLVQMKLLIEIPIAKVRKHIDAPAQEHLPRFIFALCRWQTILGLALLFVQLFDFFPGGARLFALLRLLLLGLLLRLSTRGENRGIRKKARER